MNKTHSRSTSRTWQRARGAVACLLVTTAFAGCGAPWRVNAQAVPNPLAGVGQFALMPIDFRGLQVGEGTEGDYLAEKDGEGRRKWVDDKRAMNDEYMRSLMEHASEEGITVVPPSRGGAPFVIHPWINMIEPGFYVGVAAGSSNTNMVVRITTAQGQLVDEVVMKHQTAGNIANPGVGHRLRDDAEGLGEITADYLRGRVFPEG